MALNLEDVAGCPNTRNYICPGDTVQYECGNNMSTITIWGGSLLNCPNLNNRLLIFSTDANATTCGTVSGIPVNITGGCFWSRVTFTATTSLDGTTVRCQDNTMLIDTDEVDIVGMLIIKEHACTYATVHTFIQTFIR